MIFNAPSAVRFKLTALAGLILGVSTLTGCSYVPFFSSDKPVNHAAKLDVPPAFTPPSPRAELAVPEIASARAAEAAARTEGSGVLVSGTGVKVMGGPDSRYLAVDANPDAVWPKLQGFLQDEGYVVKKIEPGVGMMETDWTGTQSADQNGFNLMSFLKIAKNTFFKPDHIQKVRIRIENGDNQKSDPRVCDHPENGIDGREAVFPR